MVDISLYQYMNEMLDGISTAFHRYMYSEIAWGSRMVGLVGPRGVGKSTLLLQYIKEHRHEANYLYVTADHIYFSNHTLVGLSDEFVMENGQYLFIDEVHKYPNWSRELKNIYDGHPSLRVVFTGSSVLDILQGEADLSRRALIILQLMDWHTRCPCSANTFLAATTHSATRWAFINSCSRWYPSPSTWTYHNMPT